MPNTEKCEQNIKTDEIVSTDVLGRSTYQNMGDITITWIFRWTRQGFIKYTGYVTPKYLSTLS